MAIVPNKIMGIAVHCDRHSGSTDPRCLSVVQARAPRQLKSPLPPMITRHGLLFCPHGIIHCPQVDELIAARGLGDLFFLDGESFHGVFSLPKFLRKSMGAETRVLGDGHYANFVGGGETVAEKGC